MRRRMSEAQKGPAQGRNPYPEPPSGFLRHTLSVILGSGHSRAAGHTNGGRLDAGRLRKADTRFLHGRSGVSKLVGVSPRHDVSECHDSAVEIWMIRGPLRFLGLLQRQLGMAQHFGRMAMGRRQLGLPNMPDGSERISIVKRAFLCPTYVLVTGAHSPHGAVRIIEENIPLFIPLIGASLPSLLVLP